MERAMEQIICNDIELGYERHVVSRQVKFSVNEGEYLCIVGHNGTGKSTLIKTLLQLVSPLNGQVEFMNGLKISDIGYLPQQTNVQKDFPASVYEVVRSGCLNQCGLRPFYNKKEREQTEQAMKRLGIESLRTRCYRELSGGQQQRVLLARAICAMKKILILDEPVAGLDPTITKELYEMLQQLNQEDGITIIMISHDLESALEYATHILHMGQTPLFFGEKEAYKEVVSSLWKEGGQV